MLKTLRNRCGDLLLWLYCLALVLFKLRWAYDLGLQVDARLPTGLAHLYSAQTLAQGDWLGPFRYIALLVRPGYTFWIALNYILGIPLVLGSNLLLIASAFVLLLSLRKMGFSRLLTALLYTVLLLDPVTRALYAEVSPLTLSLPLLLLAGSCYFLSIYQEKSGRKAALWLCSGACLAFYWISLADPWMPLFMASWIIVWELQLQPPDHSWRLRLRWILPLILALIIPAALSDLGIRAMNQNNYGLFVLKKASRSGVESFRVKNVIPPIGELATKVGGHLKNDRNRQHLEISGWAIDPNEEIKRIQLIDQEGQVIGETAEFIDRPDVQAYLLKMLGWKAARLDSGFQILSKGGPGSKESLQLIFLDGNGKPIQTLGLEVLGDAGSKFSYYLDSIQWKDPGQVFWQKVASWSDLIYSRFLDFLFVPTIFTALLLAISKFGGTGVKTVDFWLVLLSGFLALLIYQALQENVHDFQLSSRQTWPLGPCFLGLSLLLFWQARDAILAGALFRRSRLVSWFQGIRVERLFLTLALSFGAFFVIFNPPFQAPDEGAHSYRAYQTSQFKSSHSDVPISLIQLIGRYSYLSFRPENKVSREKILAEFKAPLKPEEKSFAGSIGVSVFPYIPQATGIFIARILGLPLMAMIYLGRFFNLLAYCGLIFLTLRRLPFFKWPIFALALGPMALYEAASLSHDSFTIGVTFLLTATFLARAYGSEDRVSKLQIFELAVLCILASLAKAVYFPLVLLYFWIPVRKIGSWPRFLILFAILLGTSFGVDVMWNFQSGMAKWATKVGEEVTRPIRGSFSLILQQPWEFLKLAFETMRRNTHFYVEGFLGRLGWLDTEIPAPTRAFYGISLLILAFYDRSARIWFGLWNKTLAAAVFLIVLFGLLVTFYVSWTIFGSPFIDGIQGRYFLPVGPLFLLIFYRNQPKPWADKAVPIWATLAVIMTLLVSGAVMLNRYYYL